MIPDALPLSRISDYVFHHAQHKPDASAMALGDTVIDYRGFSNSVDACAKAMLAAGIGHGDRVATLSTPHPDFLVQFLAASSIGAIWLGLNPRYTLDEYQYVVGDAQPKLLLTRTQIGGRDYRQDLLVLLKQNRCIESCAVAAGDPPFEGAETWTEFSSRSDTVSDTVLSTARKAVRESDPALLVYTSGSTGRPKGALLPHRGLVRCSHVQLRYWNPEPLRILNFFPINHVGCVGDVCAYTLVGGGTVVFLEQFDPKRQLEEIQQHRITLWGGVPTTLQLSIQLADLESYDLSSIKTIAWSGAAAPLDLARRLHAICPYLSNAYGMTETAGSVTFVEPCDDLEVLTETVGRPVPDYDVRIVHPDGRDINTGETGEIIVKGDFLMTGYWRRPKETAEAFDAAGYLHTGDLAVLRPDGNLKLVGRIREMFKSGGYNVYPLEVEKVIEAHESVALAAVVAAPDPLYGEVGCAYIALRPGAAFDQQSLHAHCRNHLANYKIPKYFSVLEQMPMLPIGKIDRQDLKRRARNEHG